MQPDQTTNLISPFTNFIAVNSVLIIIFIVVAICIIILLSYIISRIYKNDEALKAEFITIIAHKFNTPLSKMKWLSESLLSDELDSYKKENLHEIHEANEQLIKLTGTLVELTDDDGLSRATYSFEKTNICEMVKGVGDELKKTFHEKNLRFSVNCGIAEIFTKIDKTRMEFAIQVIMQNACIYTPPGRNVDVTVSVIESNLYISVSDNGIGIDGPDLPNIFKKFYRTKNAETTDTEGFGIGLYLAQSIVKRHKGKIEVYSKGLNQGSTFTIIIPVAL